MTNISLGRRYVLNQVPIEEFFDSDEEAEEVFAIMRRKVVKVMLEATCPVTKRCTGKDNYIVGLEDSISALVAFIVPKLKRPNDAYGHNRLPKAAVKLSRYEWDQVLRNLHYKMVCAILLTMREDKNLYYMDGDWMFSNVIRIEYDRAAREVKQAWRNDRTFHGRPSKQGRRRAREGRVAAGLSTSRSQFSS